MVLGIQLPQALPEWLMRIVAIVPGQFLAMHLAIAKGIDPENPRWIRKVTLTRTREQTRAPRPASGPGAVSAPSLGLVLIATSSSWSPIASADRYALAREVGPAILLHGPP